MTVLIATGLRREARLMAGPCLLAVAGGGVGERLEQALEEIIAAERNGGGIRALLSSGLAGALDPGLRPGAILIGEQGEPRLIAALRHALPVALKVNILGCENAVATVEEKRHLREQSRASAVDMESHVVARVARRHGLPFAILRVISDAATETLPPAALLGMRPDGSMAIGAVLGSIVRDATQIPALIRTGWNAELGFRVLFRCHRSLRLADVVEHALDVP